MFDEVAPGVYSVDSRFVDGKNGIVFGERSALAVDGSNFPDEGQAMADFIRPKGFEPDRLVLTHGHGDHVLGAAPLAGGEVLAHARTPAVIREQIPGWSERWGLSDTEAECRVIWPTVTFQDALWIDLGGRRVRVFSTPGHSEDGVSVYVEEDRVLFAGDTVVTSIVPAIGNGNSEVLGASLDRLVHMEIEVLVPGHGDVLQGANRVVDWLGWQILYLSGVRDAVQGALDREEDPQEAADFHALIGDRLPSDRNNMPDRHRNTVAKVVEEELAKRA